MSCILAEGVASSPSSPIKIVTEVEEKRFLGQVGSIKESLQQKKQMLEAKILEKRNELKKLEAQLKQLHDEPKKNQERIQGLEEVYAETNTELDNLVEEAELTSTIEERDFSGDLSARVRNLQIMECATPTHVTVLRTVKSNSGGKTTFPFAPDSQSSSASTVYSTPKQV